MTNNRERMSDERFKWLREYLTPVKDIVPVTMECLDEIDALKAEMLSMEVENERLWHALSQTYALLPPERVKLADGAKWMFENHKDSYERVREKD